MNPRKHSIRVALFLGLAFVLSMGAGLWAGSSVANAQEPVRIQQDDPSRCETHCNEAHAKMVVRCQNADDVAACTARADERLAKCLARCEKISDRPSCDERCQAAYDKLVNRCENADDPAACVARADAQLAKCLDRCANPRKPKPRPTCEERCEAAYKHHLTRCEGADDPDACAAKAKERYDRCLEHCANPPERPSCEDRCKAAFEKASTRCAGSDNPEDCQAKVQAHYDRCIDRCAKDNGGGRGGGR